MRPDGAKFAMCDCLVLDSETVRRGVRRTSINGDGIAGVTAPCSLLGRSLIFIIVLPGCIT